MSIEDKQAKARWQKLAGVKVLKEIRDSDDIDWDSLDRSSREMADARGPDWAEREETADPWDFKGDDNREQLAYIIWDLYKEVNGTRPRFMHFASMSEEEMRQKVESLQKESEAGRGQEEEIPAEDEKHFVDPLPSSDEIDDMAAFYHDDSAPGYDGDMDNLPKFGGNKLKEAPSVGDDSADVKKLQDEAMQKASQLVKAMSASDSPLGGMEHVKLLGVIMDVAQDAFDMGHDKGYAQAEQDMQSPGEGEARMEHEREHGPERLGEEDESGIKEFYGSEAAKIEAALNKEAQHLFDKPVGAVVKPLSNIIAQATAHKEPFHVRQARNAPVPGARKPGKFKIGQQDIT